MTDSPTPDEQHPDADGVAGGGPGAATPQDEAIRTAAMKLQLLTAETRERVLEQMDPSAASKIRDYLSRPHAEFTTDVAARRRLIHETADRVTARRTADTDRMVEEFAAMPAMAEPSLPGQPPRPVAAATSPPADPLDRLRELHPAAIARAMQGERAEAWAIVLDRLDDGARTALQAYLDSAARTAIADARARQADLAATAPALLATVIAAIARTVVPRAMREHHQLLSTTPVAWTGTPA